VTDREPEARWRTVIEDIDREALEADDLGKTLAMLSNV
jgi:hypothetical protein